MENSILMMEYTKIDDNSVEVVHRQKVFKKDIESEKQTIEERLGALNAILSTLNK